MHAFTVIRQNHAKPFKDELPYVVAIAELEERPRMMGNVTGIDPGDMQNNWAGRVTMCRPRRDVTALQGVAGSDDGR